MLIYQIAILAWLFYVILLLSYAFKIVKWLLGVHESHIDRTCSDQEDWSFLLFICLNEMKASLKILRLPKFP